MFDKVESRIITILGILGFLSCFFSLSLLSRTSVLDFNFPIEKDEIINMAGQFIDSQGFSSNSQIRRARILSNQEAVIYIQKVLSTDETKDLLGSLPLYYWQINYVYLKDKKLILFPKAQENFIKVLINPVSSKIIGFYHPAQTQDYRYNQNLSKKELEAIACAFFKSIDFDISNFKMARFSSIEKRCIFEWLKEAPKLKKASLKVKLEINGNKVSNFNYFLETPAIFSKSILAKLNFLIFYVLNSLTFGLGIFILIISIIKRRLIEWNFGFIFAFLILIAYSVTLLKITDYKDKFIMLFFVNFIFGNIVYFLWTFILAGVTKYFAKEANLNLFPVKISSSILVSYVFLFSGLGFTMMFFIFIMNIMKPVTTLGFDSFFSEFTVSKFSCIIAPLLSLSAAVLEEMFFRGFMISFFKKTVKKTIWLIIMSSLVWSFLHVDPFGYSDVYPAFIKGLVLLPMGILLGFIFIKFGLVCAIVTHYLHDLVIIGSSYLEFSNFRYVNESVVALLISAILPLLLALYFKKKELNA